MTALLLICILLAALTLTVIMHDQEQAVIGPRRQTPLERRGPLGGARDVELQPRSRKRPTIFSSWLGRWRL